MLHGSIFIHYRQFANPCKLQIQVSAQGSEVEKVAFVLIRDFFKEINHFEPIFKSAKEVFISACLLVSRKTAGRIIMKGECCLRCCSSEI